MFKTCSKCKNKLPISEFNWKIKNIRRAGNCKNCSRKYIREHYKNNREYYLIKAQKRNSQIRKKCREFIGNYLLTHPCVDCGEDDILVLEFDHIDRIGKELEVSRIIRESGSVHRLENEIAKCEVRCANCHRRKTAIESECWKLIWAPVA
jgi:hypothetical protein